MHLVRYIITFSWEAQGCLILTQNGEVTSIFNVVKFALVTSQAWRFYDMVLILDWCEVIFLLIYHDKELRKEIKEWRSVKECVFLIFCFNIKEHIIWLHSIGYLITFQWVAVWFWSNLVAFDRLSNYISMGGCVISIQNEEITAWFYPFNVCFRN